ncbi:MAG: aminotransferase class I/II-fold pyridoxal phosphate-dependent enzyme [Thermoanaerobaculia bacterium]|nr:aminotransferase class I/II-fold pyridoxal phosphate-dependent enzyme [Thermoanaerobaculia bacterium]
MNPQPPVVDLRSDTVTRPDEAMRRAMATAAVGDDVYREDPTVRELEETMADLLGTESALFMPTGTMGNQVALHVLGKPGSEVVGEASSHIFRFEMGAMAALSGMIPRPVVGDRGQLDPARVEAAINPRLDYIASTALLVVENSHNLGGGTVTNRDQLDRLLAVAQRHRVATHLDGARLFNAAVALDVAPATLVRGFDSVMVALSKGLGAPIGSMLGGSTAFVEEARRVRKMFGGGMRQVGILASAGLEALSRGFGHLAEDHDNARRVALALDRLPGVRCPPASIVTNIVVAVTVDPVATLSLLRRAGLRAIQLGPDSIRCVTHRDAPRELIEVALARLDSIDG